MLKTISINQFDVIRILQLAIVFVGITSYLTVVVYIFVKLQIIKNMMAYVQKKDVIN